MPYVKKSCLSFCEKEFRDIEQKFIPSEVYRNSVWIISHVTEGSNKVTTSVFINAKVQLE